MMGGGAHLVIRIRVSGEKAWVLGTGKVLIRLNPSTV